MRDNPVTRAISRIDDPCRCITFTSIHASCRIIRSLRPRPLRTARLEGSLPGSQPLPRRSPDRGGPLFNDHIGPVFHDRSHLAREAIDRIRVLFQLEEAAKDLSDDARAAIRTEKAGPLLEELKAWLDLTELHVLPKSPLGKAVGYAKNQCTALSRYLDDGRLSISNNAAERALRPLAVGRKNWLFFQREGGGRTAAILMSLLMTAKAAGIHPGDYFKDVLLRISTCTDARLLTPHGWKAHFEAEVTARRNEILERILAA